MNIKHYQNGIVWVKDDAHITTLVPGQDTSDQPQEVQDYCAALWTQEVVDAYRASQRQPTVEEQAEMVISSRRAAYATEVDPLVLEAMRLKHAGDNAGAVALLDQAQALVADIKARFPKS